MLPANWRLAFIFVSLFGFALLIGSKLFFIQIRDGSFYRALAEGQQKWFVEEEGERGDIVVQDKLGNQYILATTRDQHFVYTRKDEFPIDDIEKVSEVAAILDLSAEQLQEDVAKLGDVLVIKEDLSEEEVDLLEEANVAGVYVRERSVRTYPQGTFAAQTVGFLGGEGFGQYGVEGYYDELMRGKTGLITGERNPWGFSLGVIRDQSHSGADVVLSLDYNIQLQAERLLQEWHESLEFRAGQVIVMNPHTGHLYALAHYPSFDINRYGEQETAIFQNGAVQKIYEPGSVFKPFVMAAGIEEGVLTPDTTYQDTGSVTIGSYTIYNYDERVYGEETMRGVLERSINTGAVFAERQVGHRTFLDYIEKFGFLEKTGVDLQGEVYSENKNLLSMRDINFATASFGQGIETTPIQMAAAFGVLANGGLLVEPTIIDRVIAADGAEIVPELTVRRRVISPETSEEVTSMLVSVVEDGFGRSAGLPGYYVGGKTGTAQVAYSALGEEVAGYSEQTVQSFIGMLPAYEPEFVIMVKLDDPQTRTAEYSAIPVFHDLAEYIAEYWPVAPDYVEE